MNATLIPHNQLFCNHVHIALDGMGYYDDGEEHVGVADDALDGKRKLRKMSFGTVFAIIPTAVPS
jgi:hypothetical protein